MHNTYENNKNKKPGADEKNLTQKQLNTSKLVWV